MAFSLEVLHNFVAEASTWIIVFCLIGLVILVHELGHYFSARRTRMHVEELSIGIGNKVYSSVKDGIQYSVRLLPFFGYVKIAGMGPFDEDDPDGFNNKSFGARAATLAAGSGANFLLAMVLFCALGMVYGQAVRNTSQIDRVYRDKPAAAAGFQRGDRIVAVAGKRTTDVDEITKLISSRPEKPTVIEIERDGRVQALTVTPEKKKVKEIVEGGGHRDKTIGRIGIAFHQERRQMGFVESLVSGTVGTLEMIVGMVYYLWLALIGRETIELMGPVGIASDLQSQVALGAPGIPSLLQNLAMLSLSLGILNLIIPFPALDGGRLAFLLVERIRGKHLDRKVEMYVNAAGLSVLLVLAVVVTIRDILNL